MQFDDAKSALREGYIKLGFTVEEEHQRELYLSKGAFGLKVTAEEIDEYAAFAEDAGRLEQKPNTASITSTSYREQLVRILDPLRGSAFILTRNNGFLFGTREGDNPYIEIGPPSAVFFSRLRLNPDFVESALWRMRHTFGSETIHGLASRIATIKVFNLAARNIDDAIERSDRFIHTAFFELAYLKRLPVGIVEEWPASPAQRQRQSFRQNERHVGRDLPFPRTAFNRDIVRFYLLGMSSQVPVLQFLSFYQVLEYFFLAISDERLYQRLTKRLNDPRFSIEPKSLDRMIQDVIDHKRTTDETEMLKLVLERYVDEAELSDFIKAYEEYLGEPYYTKRRRRFGAESEVKLVSGHLFGNVAKVVKTVRNALVHSSDFHERVERHVPFSESTRLVEMEVPLLQFLAERVIIASSR